MARISDFTAKMQGGGARANQFSVSLNIPGVDNQAVSFLCNAASLPGSNITDIEVFYRGRQVHFAGERTFTAWSVEIYSDNDFIARNALEKWHNRILSYNSTNGTLSPNTYMVGQMEVNQLDRNDALLKQYRFYDVYPTVIGPIQLSYDANNRIETFSVDFTFNYFEPIGMVG